MSWKLTGIASKKRVGSTTRKFLLVAMCDKANDDGSGVYASFATLANMIEASRPTVKRIVKEFLDEGLIKHVGMRKCPRGETNEYDVDVDKLEALPDIGANPVHGEPGSQRTRSKATPHGGHGDPGTRVMVNPKPILKPIQEPLVLGSNEPKTPKPKARTQPRYTPEFETIWRSWPSHRRANSDKQTAFRRYLSAVEIYGAEPIAKAAAKYLGKPDTRKENYRYCTLVEVFMNGKLEAAVEDALGSLPASKQERWDPSLKAWVEHDV